MAHFWQAYGLAIAAWLFLNYFPNQETIESFNRFYSSQQSQQIWGFKAVIKNIVIQPFFLYAVKTPAILISGQSHDLVYSYPFS